MGVNMSKLQKAECEYDPNDSTGLINASEMMCEWVKTILIGSYLSLGQLIDAFLVTKHKNQ